MRKIALLAMLCMVFAVASCDDSGHPIAQQSAQPAAPAYPAEVDTVAQKLLGSETNVIAYGDLAKNGKQEAFIVNKVKIVPESMPPGLLVTRAAIIEKDGNSWNEVLLVDEHLKNPRGFLGGQPIAPVDGWRVQKEEDVANGLELYFTPLHKPAGGYTQTYEVRWNPEKKRFESMDQSFEHFLGELQSLQPVDER
ncbi:MAG TPA: hypothetical protein VKB26_15375 [Candidatus Acidoferrales bacterium]|nr:hypothetical protein [Candidatus Acidoferrales bacterium]